MSKLQHTPGPWKSYNTDPVETELDIVIESQFSTIGWLYSGKENSDANARLIAAAPEMLEALITTYKAFNTDGHEHDCGQPCEGCECFPYCPNIKIKQAIEKATGISIEEILK